MSTAPLSTKQVEKMHNVKSMNVQQMKNSVSPLLAIMLGVLAIFPFVVRFLPVEFRHYLELLFR